MKAAVWQAQLESNADIAICRDCSPQSKTLGPYPPSNCQGIYCQP